jgi:PAS domain S-box-containing protein
MAPAHTNGSLNGMADRPVLPTLPPADGDGHAGRLFYQELFEFAFDGQLVTDPHGVILDANQAAAALLRCPKEFLVGKPLGVLVAAADRATFYNHLLRLPSTSTTLLDVRVGGIRAEPRDVVAMVAPAAGEAGGRPAAYRWVLRDVTGARRAEQELLWERELLQGVVDGADAIILVVDPNGRILRSNPYLHDVSGFEGADLSGQAWCDVLLAPADRPAGWRVLGQAVAHRSARTGPLGLRTRHGAERWVAWSARGLHARAETGVVLVGHDVTDLQEAQAKALRAERLAAIGQVAAGLAHESRNALQRSQACLSMLGLRLADRADVAELLDRAQRAQDDLHRLYEGVLNYAAPVRVEAVPCDLTAAWREAWADLAATAGWGEAELVEAGDAADAECVADCFHLRRVFRNLFENSRAAVAGPLRVTVRWAPATVGRRPALRVGVRDNGPGFPPGARGRLFEAFYTTKVRGTGLGLALCKRVIDEHGGRIEAGATGPGAEVIITLPRSTS